METKQCRRCKKEKPTTEFYSDSRRKDGLRSYCKKCEREKNNIYLKSDKGKAAKEQYLAKNGERLKIGSRERLQRWAEFLNEYKTARGCCICKEKTPVVLDFHHFGEKKRMVATMRGFSIEETMAEIDNCVILCSNCHRKLHAGLIELDYLSL